MKHLLNSVLCLCLLPLASAMAQSQTVFILRHAEKAAEPPNDPVLSRAGNERAARLPGMFENALPQVIFSTQFQRTQLTAKPLAEAAGIAVSVLDINKENAGQYAELLRQRICALPDKSIVVVIGHSNTVPDAVAAWSGMPVAAIPDTRYDRIYMLRLENCKATDYLELRY